MLLYLGVKHCGSIVRDHFPGLQKTDISLEFMLSFLAILVQLGAGGGPGQGAGQDNMGDQEFCTGLTTGLAYAAGLTVYRGALNPARALGPAFVANRLLIVLFACLHLRKFSRWNLHWVHWVGPLLGAACAALSCHLLLFSVDDEEVVEVNEEKENGRKGRGQRNAVYLGGGADHEEAPLCVSLSTSQLLHKSASTRPLNRSMSGGPEWRGGEGERREGEDREVRREVAGRVEKEEVVEAVDKNSGSSSGYMSGPPGKSK